LEFSGKAMNIKRSFVSVVGALVVVTLIAETLEFFLIALFHGGFVTDQDLYFSIRNSAVFIPLKLGYNFGAAVVAGYVLAWIAGYKEMTHCIVVASLQTLSFLWAIFDPEISTTAPLWLWVLFIIFTIPGFFVGVKWRLKKKS